MYVWEGRNCKNVVDAHDNGVTAMFHADEDLTGGNDGKVKLWSINVELIATFDISYGTYDKRICAVFWSKDGARLLAGTLDCQIFELSGITGSNIHKGPAVSAHKRHGNLGTHWKVYTRSCHETAHSGR